MNEPKVDELRQHVNDFAAYLQQMEPMSTEQAEDVHQAGTDILCKIARLLPECGALLCRRIDALVTDAPPFENESNFISEYSQATAVEIAEALTPKHA